MEPQLVGFTPNEFLDLPDLRVGEQYILEIEFLSLGAPNSHLQVARSKPQNVMAEWVVVKFFKHQAARVVALLATTYEMFLGDLAGHDSPIRQAVKDEKRERPHPEQNDRRNHVETKIHVDRDVGQHRQDRLPPTQPGEQHPDEGHSQNGHARDHAAKSHVRENDDRKQYTHVRDAQGCVRVNELTRACPKRHFRSANPSDGRENEAHDPDGPPVEEHGVGNDIDPFLLLGSVVRMLTDSHS